MTCSLTPTRKQEKHTSVICIQAGERIRVGDLHNMLINDRILQRRVQSFQYILICLQLWAPNAQKIKLNVEDRWRRCVRMCVCADIHTCVLACTCSTEVWLKTITLSKKSLEMWQSLYKLTNLKWFHRLKKCLVFSSNWIKSWTCLKSIKSHCF